MKAENINKLAALCHAIAKEHGFYDDAGNVGDIIFESLKNPGLTTEERTILRTARRWFNSVVEQAAIARMHSELSEWLESVRHGPLLSNPMDDHCPIFKSQEIEAADVIIRVLDTCAYKGYRIGEAIIAKMEYNRTRPYKHGKNS